MSAVAYWSGTAELEQRAEEVRVARSYRGDFDTATESLRMLAHGVTHVWSSLSETERDIFRHLADMLVEAPKTRWPQRWFLTLRFFVTVVRRGLENVTKEVTNFENARRDFVAAVYWANERDDAKFQAVLSDAIASSLNDPSRVKVQSKEELDEWFRRLPS